MTFGERLRRLRSRRGLTQQELADRIGVSVVSVRCWEQGKKNPSMDALVSLGHTLQTSIDALLDFKPDELSSNSSNSLFLSYEEQELLNNYQSLDEHGKNIVKTLCAMERERMDIRSPKPLQKSLTQIPKYTIAPAAGTSGPANGAEFEMLTVNEKVPDGADYAVEIHGNSMLPYIHDKETVYVRKTSTIGVGQIGIFCVGDAMYCKQYYIDEAGNITLASANPELKHTNVYIRPEYRDTLQIMGQALLGQEIPLPDYLFNE